MLKTRITALLLTLVILLGLAACNDPDKADADSSEFDTAGLSAQEPAEEYYEQWSGEGGSYVDCHSYIKLHISILFLNFNLHYQINSIQFYQT